MQYYNSTVFQKNYIFRYISDTQAVYCDLKSQTVLIRATSKLSRTIDSRRLRQFTIVQQAEIRRYPEIKLLYQKLQLFRKIFRDNKKSISKIKETLLYYKY